MTDWILGRMRQTALVTGLVLCSLAGTAQASDTDPTPSDPTDEPFEIEWEGDFTRAERARIVRLMEEIRERIDELLRELDAIEARLTEAERAYVEDEFDAFRQMLLDLAGYMDADWNLEIYRDYDEDRDSDAWIHVGGYWGLVYHDPELYLNDYLNWNDLTDDALRIVLFHEISHLAGTEDDDSEGELMNADMIDDIINASSVEGFNMVSMILLRASWAEEDAAGDDESDDTSSAYGDYEFSGPNYR